MEENKVYFLMGMSMDDFMIVMTISKRFNQTPQQFIMDSLKTHLVKLQEEAQQLAKVKANSPSAKPVDPETEKKLEGKGKKEDDKK